MALRCDWTLKPGFSLVTIDLAAIVIHNYESLRNDVKPVHSPTLQLKVHKKCVLFSKIYIYANDCIFTFFCPYNYSVCIYFYNDLLISFLCFIFMTKD